MTIINARYVCPSACLLLKKKQKVKYFLSYATIFLFYLFFYFDKHSFLGSINNKNAIGKNTESIFLNDPLNTTLLSKVSYFRLMCKN